MMFVRIQLFLWLFSVSLTVVFAAPLRHSLSEKSDLSSEQMQGACLSFLQARRTHGCNPGLFYLIPRAEFNADILMKVNEDAFGSTYDLLFRPVEKKTLEALFDTRDFETFAALLRLQTVNSYFEFSYVPLFAVGGYKVVNPSLPEIAFAGAKSQILQVSSGIDFAPFLDLQDDRIGVGANIFGFDRTFVHASANTLSLLLENVDTIVKKQTETGVDADVGMTWIRKDPAWPSFGIVVQNVFSPANSKSERTLDIEHMFRRKSRLGLGYSVQRTIGEFYLGVALPFVGFFSKWDKYATPLAAAYSLGRFQAFTSFSPLIASLGFAFSEKFYSIGIRYTDEKQENSIQFQRQENMSLFGSVGF